VIVPKFCPVTPVIAKASPAQLCRDSIPASSTGLSCIVTVLVVVAAAQTGSPVAVNRMVKVAVSLVPGVYKAVVVFALVKVPLEVPTVVQSTEVAFVAMTVAVNTFPSHSTPVGAVVTVGAGLIVIVISL
jgi:hypothetical protein